jgi:hypothetical protein
MLPAKLCLSAFFNELPEDFILYGDGLIMITVDTRYYDIRYPFGCLGFKSHRDEDKKSL